MLMNVDHQVWMKIPDKNSGPSLRLVSPGSIDAAFFVEGPPNCASAQHAPATRYPHGAMVSLCGTAEDATEAMVGEVPISAERRHSGKAASSQVGWGGSNGG